MDIQENFLSLMADGGETRDDIKVPDSDIGKEIRLKHENSTDFVVTILKACGEEAAVATKNAAK